MTRTINSSGSVTQAYLYDAFGNQLTTIANDTNPFRYCGEYYDGETENYYLRTRYYDPGVGRFTQQDTHWTTANMIYGDTVQKLNITVDAEGGEYFTAIPQLLAIRQAGNLYGYAANDPVFFVDYSGKQATPVYFDQNQDFTLRMGSFLLGAAISAMLIDKLIEEDPPILYTKKGTNGPSHPNSAVSMGGSSPASPDPDDDDNRGTKTPSTTLYNKNGIHIDVENPGTRPGQVHVHTKNGKFIYDVTTNTFRTFSGELAPKSVQNLLKMSEVLRAIGKGMRYLGY